MTQKSSKILCGIYFLFKQGRLSYIGQSTDILTRVKSHKSAGREFEEFFFMEAAERDLNRIEQGLIFALSPSGNIAGVARVPAADIPNPTDPVRYYTKSEAADYMRMSERFLDRAAADGTGPKYIRVGSKVLYSKASIDTFLTNRQVRSAAEELKHPLIRRRKMIGQKSLSAAAEEFRSMSLDQLAKIQEATGSEAG